MVRTLFLSFFLFLANIGVGQVSNIEILYSISFQKDSNDIKRMEEPAKLLIVGDRSLFQTVKWAYSDSIRYFKADKSNYKGASEHRFTILKDFKAQTIKHHEQFVLGTEIFAYSEPIEEVKWEITSDTLTINKLKCQKAITNFGNRKWEVWFSNEIQISDGPYKFSGLPGLVVRAYDSKKTWLFDLMEIKNTPADSKIDLSYLPKPKATTKSEFYKTKMYYKENAIQIRQASMANSNSQPIDNETMNQMIKNSKEALKRDNNWIEMYP